MSCRAKQTLIASLSALTLSACWGAAKVSDSGTGASETSATAWGSTNWTDSAEQGSSDEAGSDSAEGAGAEDCAEPGLAGCSCSDDADCDLGLICVDSGEGGSCVAPSCGDGRVLDGEACDGGGVLDPLDPCLLDCTRPRSCLDIALSYAGTSLEDGAYELFPDLPESTKPWLSYCDMTTVHASVVGGWTRISTADICTGAGRLDVEVTDMESADDGTQTVEWGWEGCSLWTRDIGDASHSFVLDIEFPPGFRHFYLDSYLLQANAEAGETSGIDRDRFQQTTWGLAHDDGRGDVAFGSLLGVVTSFATLGADFSCEDCGQPFPEDRMVFVLEGGFDDPQSIFRIGWGEEGNDAEGWYPWSSGYIFVR